MGFGHLILAWTWHLVLFAHDLALQCHSLALAPLASRVFTPVELQLVSAGSRLMPALVRYLLNDINLLLLRPESLWLVHKPAINRNIVPLNAEGAPVIQHVSHSYIMEHLRS